MTIQFQIDVSRLYRNKEGYKANGYLFNRSFQTETHLPITLLTDVIQQGWPYTVHHAKREPSETGADKRGCATPKHCENFLGSSVLTADDDSQTDTVIQSWLNDQFFSRYGWAFVESCSSMPQQHKGHPILIFDAPITDLNLWRECLKAFAWAYPQVDRAMTNPVCTFYNKEGSSVYLVNGVNNLCSFTTFEQEVLQPYRSFEAERRARLLDCGEISIPANIENNRANAWVRQGIHNLLREIATAPVGQRHITIRDKSKRIGHLLAADWHSYPLSGVITTIMRRVEQNGYLQEHSESATRQLVSTGLRLGASDPAPFPSCLQDKTIEDYDLQHNRR